MAIDSSASRVAEGGGTFFDLVALSSSVFFLPRHSPCLPSVHVSTGVAGRVAQRFTCLLQAGAHE